MAHFYSLLTSYTLSLSALSRSLPPTCAVGGVIEQHFKGALPSVMIEAGKLGNTPAQRILSHAVSIQPI